MGFVIRIYLTVKSRRTKKIKVFSQVTDDSKNLKCEALYVGNYEYVNISSFDVLGIKLWLEDDGELNRMILYIHSDSFSRKLRIDTKCRHLLVKTLYAS